MTSKITPDEMRDDYDWRCAFYEAYHHRYMTVSRHGEPDDNPVERVSHVYHAAEGMHDEEDWLAVVGWSGEEGPFAVMSAGCDYTGWD